MSKAAESRSRLWIFVAFATAACSPLRVAERILQSDQVVETRDVAYGSDDRQRLDVYHPRSRRTSSPVVVFLYGGRWQSGSKELYHLLGNELASRGVLVVVPDYRLYPQVLFPRWVEDAARSVRWTKQNIQRFGGDTSRIFVAGHSSGAHTAVLLAVDERYLREVGLSEKDVKGYVSIAGPVDTIWTDADVQALMGPRDGWTATYPRSHIDGTQQPILLLHGISDKTVSPRNSTDFASRIRERGGCAKTITYRGIGHIGIIVALSAPQLTTAPVFNDVMEFVQAPAVFCRNETFEELGRHLAP